MTKAGRQRICKGGAATPFLLGAIIMGSVAAMNPAADGQVVPGTTTFGPTNPFYAPSALPYQAPPFDKIKDTDYQPAIEAGMAEQRREIDAIAVEPGSAYLRQHDRRHGAHGAALQPGDGGLQRGFRGEHQPDAPGGAGCAGTEACRAHSDAIYLDAKLFARVSRPSTTSGRACILILNRAAWSRWTISASFMREPISRTRTRQRLKS